MIAAGTQSGFHGVAVTAMNSDDIAAVGASVGVGGGAGVAVGGTVDVITATTKASIGKNTHINDPVSGTIDPNQSVSSRPATSSTSCSSPPRSAPARSAWGRASRSVSST